MFNYKSFKKEMKERGHRVYRRGRKIVVEPNNNYLGYGKGFLYFSDIVEGYELDLKCIDSDHFNTWIYEAVYKVV